MGHHERDIWAYTPRQVQAYIFIGRRRQRRKLSEQLTLGSLAASGDKKAVRETLRKLDEAE